jgi:hypothetical protein
VEELVSNNAMWSEMLEKQRQADEEAGIDSCSEVDEAHQHSLLYPSSTGRRRRSNTLLLSLPRFTPSGGDDDNGSRCGSDKTSPELPHSNPTPILVMPTK